MKDTKSIWTEIIYRNVLLCKFIPAGKLLNFDKNKYLYKNGYSPVQFIHDISFYIYNFI